MSSEQFRHGWAMSWVIVAVAAALFGGAGGAAGQSASESTESAEDQVGPIVISEIMYNPDSYEHRTDNQVEWIEIFNPTDTAVDLGGWHLADEDGRTEALPEGTVIKPGEAVVLIPGLQTVTDFQAAWGEGFAVYPLNNWTGNQRGTLRGLANAPSNENEVLTLRRQDGKISDRVNYDDGGDWPKDSPPGPGIYLKPGSLGYIANDDGKNWQRGTLDKDGGRKNTKTADYDGDDIGSPGRVVEK